MTDRVSQRELARRMGVNPAHVNRLVKRGVVRVDGAGLIDAAAAMEAITASRSVAHHYLDDVNARQKGKARAPGGDGEPGAVGDGDDGLADRGRYNKARAMREAYAASLQRLEFQRRSGQLVEIATAERVLFEQARAARDAWLNWPARVGPLIAATLGLADVNAVVRLLTDHVHKQVETLGIASTDFVAEQRPR